MDAAPVWRIDMVRAVRRHLVGLWRSSGACAGPRRDLHVALTGDANAIPPNATLKAMHAAGVTPLQQVQFSRFRSNTLTFAGPLHMVIDQLAPRHCRFCAALPPPAPPPPAVHNEVDAPPSRDDAISYELGVVAARALGRVQAEANRPIVNPDSPNWFSIGCRTQPQGAAPPLPAPPLDDSNVLTDDSALRFFHFGHVVAAYCGHATADVLSDYLPLLARPQFRLGVDNTIAGSGYLIWPGAADYRVHRVGLPPRLRCPHSATT